MLVYQWAFYYFIGNSEYGTRRTKYGPLFSSLDKAKEHLDSVKVQYSRTFYVGFIYEYIVDELSYGNIVYKTNKDIPIDHIEMVSIKEQ